MNTQQKIIDAAISVLNENFSATLEDIAVSCGINRRTLHRYFKSRNELLEASHKNMVEAWEQAAIKACDSSEDPLVQLEHLLYAGIDSGTKYAFLIKLNGYGKSSSTAYESKQSAAYLKKRNQLFNTLQELQKQQMIDDQFPLPWIRILFTSVITATIAALRSGDIAQNEVKRLAWYSFSRSIGIQLNKI
ncbi:TetR/AcrR family transcriptional regulator [Chryseobacterium pennae]|uniref:TetR/AcrR family transcriptional regulator n=1 Tax=Chryseobacterium pennae TaxID=2258962 RepID=A0A3D9C461_9FLAO|nr:TetR/AcrR family transcriptional regulator [Chryseobacterium pennae]REC60564.1 TetR/AcrR family transcriptional regulator [Chryseobacterium pennae]